MAVMLLLAMLSNTIVAFAQDSTPVASPDAGSELTDIDCPDLGPAAPKDLVAGEDFTCAVLNVPENHEEPDGAQLELFVIRLPSASDDPAAEPIVFLAGGPGGAGNTQLAQFTNEDLGPITSYAPLLETHEVVLIDQRGTGLSQPSLACPADLAMAATPEATPAGQDAEPQMPSGAENPVDLYGDCDDALTDAGVDLASFDTEQNAADIDALRQALGADQVNLFGTSYGSWLAQVVMRDFPDAVRSVVLDSPVPPQSNLFAGQLIAFQAALDASQRGCADDPECAAAYPDLPAQLEELVADLNAEPLTVTIEDPMSGQQVDLPVDGSLFMFVIYQMHFIGPFVPLVAPLIASVAEGQDEGLAELLPVVLSTSAGIASGFYYSVICQDEVPFTSEDEVLAEAEEAGVSQLVIENGSGAFSTGVFELCTGWDLPASPQIENEPVTSDLPTLIVTGLYDPITPTAYGEELLPTLSNATLVESGIAGHAPLSTSGTCGVDVMRSFIAEPEAELDTSCLSDASVDFSPEAPAEGSPDASPES